MPPAAPAGPARLMARLELRRQAREADERGVEHAAAGAAARRRGGVINSCSMGCWRPRGRSATPRDVNGRFVLTHPALAGNGSLLGARDLVRPACPFASRVRACQPFLKVCLNHCGPGLWCPATARQLALAQCLATAIHRRHRPTSRSLTSSRPSSTASPSTPTSSKPAPSPTGYAPARRPAAASGRASQRPGPSG